MGIFDGLSGENMASETIDPKRLFRVLSKPSESRFQFPYDIQTEVWDQWFERRNDCDLVIKMNTGSGKTVIGLLILQSSLNEGIGPSVYLVPDNQLRLQVEETAKDLGIAWTGDPRDPGFRQNKSILITNVHTVYNGQSKFGVSGSGVAPIDIGSIVIDDAHACIPIIEQQFAISIPSDSKAYELLLDRFSNSIRQQSLPGFTEVSAGYGSKAVPIPYWDWEQNYEYAFRVIDANLKENDKFTWYLIREHLHLCDVAVDPTKFEIKLPYPDLAGIRSYIDAKRRVYMTATLADDSVLTSRMGVDAKCITEPIIPSSASDLGDRLILTPMESRPSTETEEVRALTASWAKVNNVVVIVPSRYRAKQWKPYAKLIADKDTIKDVISQLKTDHVGLVVLIGRYDGVDLPNDACRVLVLDGLPTDYSPHERVEASVLGGTHEMKVRQVQRIEQGMGRGIRSTDDYCVVLLLDPRLVEQLYTASSLKLLSPATRAQYELSRKFASTSTATSIEFFDEAVKAFLARDKEWVNASKEALEDTVYESQRKVSPLAEAEHKAFRLALARNFEEAARVLMSIQEDEPNERLRGWVKQRAASYLHHVDLEGARKLQHSARSDNSYLLKIPNDSNPPKITDVIDQAVASANFLRKEYDSAQKLQLGVESLLQDLTPTPSHGSSKIFEAAVERLGLILGFNSTRPDQESGNGPDNFWVTGDGQCWVIESKSEATADEVSRDYLQQLSHSADWCKKHYPNFHECVPLLIHPSQFPNSDAVPRENARVMTFAKLEQLRDAVGKFSRAIQIENGYRDSSVIKSNLLAHGLNSKAIFGRWTQPFREPGTFKKSR